MHKIGDLVYGNISGLGAIIAIYPKAGKDGQDLYGIEWMEQERARALKIKLSEGQVTKLKSHLDDEMMNKNGT
jgi:hypothetical protein